MHGQLPVIAIIAFVLGLDAFSLAMGMGLRGVRRSYAIKFAALVGVLHVVMPLLGLELGLNLGRFLGVWASRLGAFILILIAMDFIVKGYREIRPHPYRFSEGRSIFTDKTSIAAPEGRGLILLGLSVSMDALTVGFSLGTFKMPLVITVAIMGLVAGTMTAAGFASGRILNRIVGSYAQLAGGLVLLLLAVKLVW